MLKNKTKNVAKSSLRKGRKTIPKNPKTQVALLNTARTQLSARPNRMALGSDRVVIKHREFIGTSLSQDVNFVPPISFFMNPGLSTSFPWLSTQAAGWEKYKFRKLRVHYVTRSSANSVGNILMAPDYDVQDPVPANELIMSSLHGCVESAVWTDLTMEFDPKLLNRECFITTTTTNTSNQDPRLNHVAMFLLAAFGQSTGSVLGKLWLEYEVELINQQLVNNASSSTVSSISGGNTVSSSNPLGLVTSTSGSLAMSASGTALTISGLIPGNIYAIVGNFSIFNTGTPSIGICGISGIVGGTARINSQTIATGSNLRVSSYFTWLQGSTNSVVLTMLAAYGGSANPNQTGFMVFPVAPVSDPILV